MAYCFDTSVLIECWSRSYPPDVFPGLWVKMGALITQQEVLCPEEVRVELAQQEDELAKWINARPHMFVPLDDAIQRATSEVLARHQLLMKATKNRNGADPFVIATARVKSLTRLSPRRRAERRPSPRFRRYATRSYLRSTQRHPDIVTNYFNEPHVTYAKAA